MQEAGRNLAAARQSGDKAAIARAEEAEEKALEAEHIAAADAASAKSVKKDERAFSESD